jgi:hypothetical protein
LRNRGGLFLSLWEGQPAILHFAQAKATAGCFCAAKQPANSPEGLTACSASMGLNSSGWA